MRNCRYLADGECRRPLRSEDVQANRAVRVDVRMINASSERHLQTKDKDKKESQHLFSSLLTILSEVKGEVFLFTGILLMPLARTVGNSDFDALISGIQIWKGDKNLRACL
jgi:hypothetical protein